MRQNIRIKEGILNTHTKKEEQNEEETFSAILYILAQIS